MSATVTEGPIARDQSIGRRSGRRAVSRADVLGGVAAAVGSLLIAALVLHLWDASFRIPFALGGDANLTLDAIKNLLRGSWYYTTNHLGAPLGQALYDHPSTGDVLSMLTMKVLGLLDRDPSFVLNVYYLVTFPLVAVSAYVALRVLGITTAIASALAIAYSVLPYHFMRGEPHVFLSAYYAVPIACVVLLRQMSARTMVQPPHRGVLLRDILRSRRTICALIACAIVGGTGAYYAFFFGLLAVIVGLLASIRGRSVLPLASAGILVAATWGFALITDLPTVLYQAIHGVNLPSRGIAESQLYGLNIANLVLPVIDHRFQPFAHLRAKIVGLAIPSEATETLGLIGDIGFFGLIAAGLSRIGLGARQAEPGVDGPDTLIGRLSALTIVCLLIAVIGGGGTVISALGFHEIRAWNRISVYIAFFALAGVGIWLTRLLRPRSARWILRAAPVALAVALVLLAGYDQTTPAFTPDYAAVAAQWHMDGAFVGATARALGSSASIFQLPYVPFPENPPVFGMQDYDHLRGYLHSDTLLWSYGRIKGRGVDWQRALVSRSTEVAVTGMAAVGFDGLYVDRAGYQDKAASLERQLRSMLGAPRVESKDGRLVVYDLGLVRRRLASSVGADGVRQIRSAVLRGRTARLVQVAKELWATSA